MSPKLLTRFGPKIIARIALAGVAAWMMGSTSLLPARKITDDSSTTLNTPESAIDWAELTRADLQAAYAIILENHPGVYNDLDPDFRAMAANALENALALAVRVENAVGYEYTLDAFAAKFRDGHLGFLPLNAPDAAEKMHEWPGFVMTWRNNRGIVHSTLDENADLTGSEIVSCDQRPIYEVVLSNVFEFGSDPSIAGRWIQFSPFVFLDSGNPFITRPTQCVFRAASGIESEQELQWSPISLRHDWGHRYRLSTDGPEDSLAMEVFGNERYWISLPIFSPQGEGELEQMESLITDIEAHRDSLRNAEVIVFDLRGNNGGSSSWILRIANVIWGEAFVKSRRASQGTYAEYRASQGNLEHLKTFLELPSVVNGPADVLQYFTETISGVERAYMSGDPMYSTQNNPSYKPAEVVESLNPKNLVSAKMYVFMTGRCASACLDAIDLLTQFENVTLVGMPTAADTDYLELRSETLPSERAIFGFPIKVYRDRPRPSGFYYEPDIPYPSLDLSRAAVESWLVEIISDRSPD